MYDRASASYMSAAAKAQNSGDWRHYNPNIARFFPHALRSTIWDVCTFLYHYHYLASPSDCPACRYNYGGHFHSIRRGLEFLTRS